MPDRHPPLLPADQYLAAMLWPEDDPTTAAAKYRRFRAEVESQIRIDPSKPQAGLDPISIVVITAAVIQVGLTIAASFFKPKSPEPGTGGLTATEKQGTNSVSGSRVAPQAGFDAVQQPAALGGTIPVVWARRQALPAQSNPPRPAGTYGGVRVNLGLIWSQMWTYRGSHLLRAVFLLGEGPMGLPDSQGYALGDNSLTGYYIENTAARELASRATVYVSPSGGPIRSEHRHIGRLASADVANNMNYGASTVYSVRNSAGQFAPDFCYCTKPSTSTQFGVYAHMPNNMALRINPRIRPTIRVTTKSKDDGEKFQVDCDDDPQALADIWKSRYNFSFRGGIVSTSTGLTYLNAGDRFRYRLDKGTDAETIFFFDSDNTDNSVRESSGETKCADIASAVSSRQRSADEALVLGELYKVGSCLAVLISREPDDRVFVSEGDNDPIGNGQSIEYVFRVIRSGQLELASNDYMSPEWSGDRIKPPSWDRRSSLNNLGIPDSFHSCSNFPQLFRCAIATISLARSAKIFEIGFRSSVGIRISGLCNFRDCPSLITINENAGLKYDRATFDKNDKIGTTIYQSGTIQRTEARISLFLVQYREGDGQWLTLNATWGIKGTTSDAIFNQLRFEMQEERRWELRFEPVTSYELRNVNSIVEPICVIDSKNGKRNRTVLNGGITVEWYGEIRDRNWRSFNIPALEPKENLGIPKTDTNTLIDDWAMVAEAFCYPEIQSSAESSPEHEVVYVNTFSTNPSAPTYDNIATVGLNIYASTEFRQLSQFSAYVTNGTYTRRSRENDTIGSTNLFPDILKAYLTNDRYGRGQIVGDALVDQESFAIAADWCQQRRYFYDGVDITRVNLLQQAADIASYHLLELNQRGGRWALTPTIVFPEDGPVPVKALFTAGNIVEDTLRLQFLPETERRPIRISVKWREERQTADLTASGFFPVEREVFVQEAGQSENDPIEPLDLSLFCTSFEHAVDVACFYIRLRRLVTHSIAFTTTPDGLSVGLAAGDYIKVAMDLTSFDQFANGVVLDDGTLLTTRNDLLTLGSHDVYAWDGVSEEITSTTLIVDSFGNATPTGIVFAKKSVVSDTRTYKIEKISVSEDGNVDIEAVHHPCDAAGFSEIGKNWTTYTTDTHWIIEGDS